MQNTTKGKLVAGTAAIVLATGLAVAGSSLTSAYFSDTNTGGAITGTTGSIEVDVNGNKTTTPTITFDNVLPGETRTGSFTFQNTGRSTQDVYLQFTNKALVDEINKLGTYAAIEIKVDGERVFFSDNLNDKWPGELVPLPQQLLLKAGVAPTGAHQVDFSFTVAGKFSTQIPNGPLVDKYGLNTVLSLPYSVVATQPGIAPGA